MEKYNLVKIARGKTEVIDTGNHLPKLNNRLKELKKSTKNGVSARGGKRYRVEYKIVKNDSPE